MARTRALLWHWGRHGGGPRYTLELARAMAQRGDLDVHISVSRQAEIYDAFRALGLPGLYVDTYRSAYTAITASAKLPGLRRRLQDYLQEHRIQVVDCTMLHPWNIAMLGPIRAAGAGHVLTVHDASTHPGERNPVLHWLTRMQLHAADQAITLSQHVRDQLAVMYGFDPARVHSIPHGAFCFEEAAFPEREYPVDRPFRLLFFGRLLYYKGLDLLLQAFDLLRRRFADLRLDIVGFGADREVLRATSRMPGVTLDNRWIPEREIPSILAKADLLVLPYREASQSGVAGMAYCAGLPVVATPVGGLGEQVMDGQTGKLAVGLRPEHVAAAVSVLVQQPSFYRQCSVNASRYAREALGWHRIAARVEEVLKDVAKQPGELLRKP